MEQEKLELKKTLVDYLSRVEESIPEIINPFRTGNEDDGYNKMITLIEGLTWIGDAIQMTKSYHNISINSLKELLKELIDALENRDTILIADLLEYELLPKINEWTQDLVSGKE